MAAKIYKNQSLAALTSFKVGGSAELFSQPRSSAELAQLLASTPVTTPIMFIGAGSNLLIRDGGINGLVISLSPGLTAIAALAATELKIEAGASCRSLVRYCLEHNLGGALFLAGIPGTIGGALAMNAGAYGDAIWNYVTEVTTISRSGVIQQHSATEFSIGYRSVRVPNNEWFLGASFKFPIADKRLLRAELKKISIRRLNSQPIAKATCGSVFKNPENNYAAALIEQCNLKGYKIGGAMVSTKHANFIENIGSATAQDIEALIEIIRENVLQKFNVELIPEVKIIGENSDRRNI